MAQISGVIERITYFNPENGYSVLRFKPQGDLEELRGLSREGLITVIGNFPEISPGQSLRLQGDYETHPKHGVQFRAEKFEEILPATLEGIRRYLGSGLIRGIGPQLASRIVKHFKKDTLEVIESAPGRLTEVPGIGEDRREKIIQAWTEQKKIKDIMLFLHAQNISTNLAVKIYKTYGDDALEVVRQNPYQLEQDIFGVGFKTADKIAQSLGLEVNHPSRIEAGVVYCLQSLVNEGHVFGVKDVLIKDAAALLGVDELLISPALERLVENDRVQIEELPAVDRLAESPESLCPVVYLSPYYFSEKGVAIRLDALLKNKVQASQTVLITEDQSLSQEQRLAVNSALHNPVSVITGGPGTGKTTCLKALIHILQKKETRFLLASPTGRAAKRLSEATGHPASTIHRLLGYSPMAGFSFNDQHPLKTDFVVIDEASMLDIFLANQLLRAIKPGTQVLFVGDVDQLPSVGAGDVLRDIIRSKRVPVSRLTTIFRQAEDSQIIRNAHRINQGEMPFFPKSDVGDFFLFPAGNAEKAAFWTVDVVANRIPDRFGLHPVKDIQVLTPIYRGAAGVTALNTDLQSQLNPASSRKPEAKLFGTAFRVGDKVMQIQNNYDKDVYNGDIGIVKGINRIDQTLIVLFDNVRRVLYDFNNADELVLAYAVSVHKAQGSEFPAVVMPILTQHYIMLQRNLLYTAITRAQRLCVLVGNRKAIGIAINNNRVAERNSALSYRLQMEGLGPAGLFQ